MAARITLHLGAGLTALLLLTGGWQLGGGIWVYAKARLAQHLLQKAWERTVRGEGQAKPWPWADTWPLARLQVPRHHVDLIVLAGASGRTLAFGPGHVSSSALPGQSGTAILSGHRDTHFRFLERLGTGDDVWIEMPGASYHYQVTAPEVVDARRADIATNSRSRLALITCYPFDTPFPGGPFRYVVSAELRPSF